MDTVIGWESDHVLLHGFQYYRGTQTFKHAAQKCAGEGGHIASAQNAFVWPCIAALSFLGK